MILRGVHDEDFADRPGWVCGRELALPAATVDGEPVGASFPYGTMIINVSGSFILGFFITLVTERVAVSPNWRFLIAVGLLGGYTTFSSFTVETLALAQAGRWVPALLYLMGNVGLGLVFAFLGIALARAL